jgi:hypothetical protein
MTRLPCTVVLLLSISGLLSGCFGLSATVIGTDETLTTNPKIELNKRQLSPDTYPAPQLSTEDLRKAWGDPSRKEQLAGASERWRYDFGLRWNGMVFFVVVVPLPLVIPVGYEYVEFLFENGLATKVRTAEHGIKGNLGCFYMLSGKYGSGSCRAGAPRDKSSDFYFTGQPPGGFIQ